MRRFSSSDPDALFSGRLDPDDAPPELREIAGLIQAARVPGSAHELAGEEVLVSAIAAEVRRSAPFGAVVSHRRRRLVAQMLSGKVIAATAAVLLSGGVAAAATGSLPVSIQKAVSHGLAHVGISVPDPVPHRSPVRSGINAQSNGHGLAPSATGTDRYGLCTSYLHPSKTTSATSTGTKASATAFSRLAAAAHAKNETIAQYCQGATPLSTAVGTNRSSAHRPTTSTKPVTTGRPTDKPAHNTPATVHRHPPQTVRTTPARTSTATVRKVHPSGVAHGTTANAPTHVTSPARKVQSGGSAKNTTTSTSATTTSLVGTLPGTGSSGSNVEKGVPSAHSH